MKTRKVFNELLEELENNKILLLVGPRQVGKTTLMEQLQEKVKDKKTYFLNLEDFETKNLLNTHPYNLFKVTNSNREDNQIFFIDEIQLLDNPSNFLKLIYDMFHKNIKLVVSGSSSFYIDKKFKDSLMGRKEMYEILTLDFEEFLDFKDELEIKKCLFEDKKIPILTADKTKLEKLFLEYITYGGYPEIVLSNDENKKKKKLGNLIYDYMKKDIYDSKINEVDNFFSLLKILSSQIGDLVNIQELSRTLKMTVLTIEKYIYVMKKSYCISFVKPFFKKNLRKELSKMPKVYFFDLGLRNSLLNNFESIQERLDKGQLFENVVWREFMFKFGLDNIKYRRTQQHNEVDFIIEEKKAYEIKFSKNLIKESKYQLFKTNYSDFNLEFITFDDFLQFLLEKM